MSTHPLDLPEIVKRIGHFLPLWTQVFSESKNRLEAVFDPKTFHACMLVSKLWHDTLLPVLWANYDTESMARVPEEVLVRNTHHFRTFTLQRTETCKIVGCTRLIQATLLPGVGCVGRAQRLVQSNPGLKSLVYDGGTCESPLDPNDFAQLSQLEDLTLMGWNISEPGSLGRALAPLAGSLRELSLGVFAGVDNDGDFGDTPLLPSVKYLRVKSPPYGLNPVGLIRRCPNLGQLDLTLDEDITGNKNHLITLRLSDSINKYCPNLNSLVLRGSLTQERMEALIRGCAVTNGLSEIVVILHSVTQDTVDSIASHASTLENLGIYNSIDDNADLDLLFQLAEQCPRLKWFSIAAWNRPGILARTFLDALKRSSIWRCHDLEILDMNFLSFSSSSNEKEGDSDVILLSKLFENGPVDGWYYHAYKSDIPGEEDDEEEMSVDLLRELFSVVARFGFEHLRQLMWSGATFTRSSHPASAEYNGLPFFHFD